MMLNTGPAASVGGLTVMSTASPTTAFPRLLGPLDHTLWPVLLVGHAIVALMSLIALTLTVGKLFPTGSRDLRWAPSPVNRPLPGAPASAGADPAL